MVQLDHDAAMDASTNITEAAQVTEAARRLLEGGLVAFPTETVYGLGADAENPDAVAAIYAAKGRPANHPVIVHISPEADIHYWASAVPDEARVLMQAFWPGPLTLIFPRAAHIPAMVSGGQDSVGVRCPSHPIAQALLRAFAAFKPNGQGGVAGPSANKFGQVSPTQAAHVRSEFAELSETQLLVLEGGASAVGIESTIVDVSRIASGVGPQLLRPGHISAAQLQAVLGKPVGQPDRAAPRVSGSLKAHYAPRTPLQLLDDQQLAAVLQGLVDSPSSQHIAVVAFANFSRSSFVSGKAGASIGNTNIAGTNLLNARVDWHTAPDDPDAYAQDLYALLRRLDLGDYDRILLQRPPVSPSWQAVNDRVGRAAAAFSG